MSKYQMMVFKVDQDWQAHGWPEEGSIWEFLDHSYDKDSNRTVCVFKKIGNPVNDKASMDVTYT